MTKPIFKNGLKIAGSTAHLSFEFCSGAATRIPRPELFAPPSDHASYGKSETRTHTEDSRYAGNILSRRNCQICPPTKLAFL